MKTKTFFLILLSLFVSYLAKAEINIQDGGYVKFENDLTSSVGVESFAVRRTYKSRSLYHGYFGYGWCSEFEDCERPGLHLRGQHLPWHIQLDERGEHIVSIRDTRGNVLQYDYADDNLVQVRLNRQVLARYEYDEMHNLISRVARGQPSEKLQYDSFQDRLIVWKSDKGCEEKYSYRVWSLLKTTTVVWLRCAQQESKKKVFDVFFSRNEHGKLQVQKIAKKEEIKEGGKKYALGL